MKKDHSPLPRPHSALAPRGRPARLPLRTAAALLASLTLALGACSPDSPLPPRPALVLDDFSPDVRTQIAAAEQSVSAAPDDAEANAAAAMILHAYAQREWAEVYYRRAALLAPDEPRWAYLHGVTLDAIGRKSDALATLRRAFALDPDYAPTRRRMADLLLASGDLDAAEDEYRFLERARPDSAHVQFGLGKLAIERGDLDAGVQHLQRAARMESPYGAAHFALIAAYRQLGNLDEARRQTELFEKFRGREPPWDDPILSAVAERNQSENGRMARAQRYLREQRLDAARKELDAVLASDPDSANAHNLLIAVHGALGNGEQAELHYRAALAIAPDMARLHSNYGVLRLKQRRYKEAAAAFEEAIRVDPEYATGYLNLGAVREQQGRAQDAIALYRAAIERAPTSRQAHYFLGRQLEKSGRLTAAVDEYLATLEPEDANTPWYLRALAGAYAHLRRYDEAVATLERAREVARQHRQGAAITAINDELRRVEALRDASLSRITTQ